MDQKRLTGSIEKTWNDSIVERLIAYVRIPNKSPQFDPTWERNGHMEAAVKLMADWCRARPRPRRALARRVPRRGMRQLRAALVHHLAPRPRRRHAARARAEGRRAFRHGHRHRAHAVSHSRAAARPHREPGDGRCPAR